MKNVLPLHLGNLSRQLGDNTHFVGDSLTVADTAVFDILVNNALNWIPDSLNDFPNLKKFHDHVAGHEKIGAYLASE
jgi:glutathione S-transferase